MGGTVGFSIRRSDGSVASMATWTNVTPDFFIHPDFGSDAHSESFISEFLKPDPRYPEYAAHRKAAPIGYGLNVVDHVTKTVHSHQGYTSPNTIGLSSIFIDLDTDDRRVDEMKSIADAGKFRMLEWDYSAEWVEKGIAGWEEILRDVKLRRLDFKLKFESGWTYVRYAGDVESLRDMKRNLESSGFAFTAEENEDWKAFEQYC